MMNQSARKLALKYVVALGLLVSGLVFYSAQALAAGPFVELSTGGAENIAAKSAKVTGTVTPLEGVKATNIGFEYSTGPVSGGVGVLSVAATPATVEGTAGATPVSANLSGLLPSTTYHYRVNATPEGHPTVQSEPEGEFTTLPRATVTVEEPTEVTANSAKLKGKITLNVPGPATYHFEYFKTAGGPATVTTTEMVAGEGEHAVSAPAVSLEPSTQYTVKLIVEVEAERLPESETTFTTTGLVPVVSSSPATYVSRTRAVLTGEIVTQNAETAYYFEYGEGTTYSRSTHPKIILAGAATVPQVAGPETLEELSPGKVYYYRLVASNATGKMVSPPRAFTTAPPQPPIVESESIGQVTQTTANLLAQVNPNGLPTTYTLELGTEVEGKLAYMPTFGVVREGEQLSFSLTSLLPATLYHFRVMLHNEDGTLVGADHTFETPGFPPAFQAPAPVQFVPTPPQPPEVVQGETRAEKYAQEVKRCKKIKSKKRRKQCLRTARRNFVHGTKR
jgi:hypothetical protein